MTPDVLADIYQCNITRLDDPRIQASNPDLRFASSTVLLPELSRARHAISAVYLCEHADGRTILSLQL